MKKIFLLAVLFSVSILSKAQGLENIIVEKYYISDANDVAANLDGGVLPVGSVTYRIYVDLMPGYRFQAAYGIPGHPMSIQTSTLFFNNEDRGSTTPAFSKTQAANNTVMLDSWVSVGGACNGNFGVLKSDDNGVANVVNNYTPQVLQNNDPQMGIPLTTQDGFLAGAPEQVTVVGINNELLVFDSQNDGTNGPLFYTDNGSWASLNGSVGPTVDNRVLIAQITTDGVFSFELNIQIGTPSGGTENYVASNPSGTEIQFPGLVYNSTTTGLSYMQQQAVALSVFPNPSASGVFEVVHKNQTSEVPVSYQVRNASGAMVLEKTFEKNIAAEKESIDLSGQPSGIYFLVWADEFGTAVQKLIKF